MPELIAVAMSGGVDSSVVAALLKRGGHNIAVEIENYLVIYTFLVLSYDVSVIFKKLIPS
jgi:asparagine synthetase B (glutamine-hydrolysing)